MEQGTASTVGAVVLGAINVSRHGAQASMPSRAELLALLKRGRASRR